MQVVLYFDVNELTITEFTSTNGLIYNCCPNGNVLTFSRWGNYGLFVFDSENITYTKIYSAMFNKYIEATDKTGVFVQIVNHSDSVIGYVYYHYETGILYDTFTDLDDTFVKFTCSTDESVVALYYNRETETLSAKDPFAYDITLVNATTIDESSFEEESISSEYIGQEVEIMMIVPDGHYPQRFEVLTLDSNGDEKWITLNCNGGMRGMTTFSCEFVLEESYIVNNSISIRYNSFMQM